MIMIKDFHHNLLSQIKHLKHEIALHQEHVKFIERADLALTLSKAKLAYFDGKSITGIGTGNQRKPDYLGYSATDLALGEWKSSFEPPTTSSWRTVRGSDPEAFTRIREQVAGWEQNGLSKDLGGHIIIIEGQLADYATQIGISYELPWTATHMKFAYTVPLEQKDNVLNAFNEIEARLNKKYDFELFEGIVTITFIFKESAEPDNTADRQAMPASR